MRRERGRGIVSSIGPGTWAKARTRYYRSRYRNFVTWGVGVQVRGRLRLRGPGRIVIGDDCVLGAGPYGTAIEAATATATVRIGDGSAINGLYVVATDDVTIGAGVDIAGRLHFDGSGRLRIGDGCKFDSSNAIHAVDPNVTVSIGDECYVNGLDVVATEDVTIGSRCIIGDCSMVTTDYHSAGVDRWSPDAPVKAGRITVGSNVWIAANVVVTKNVSIGDNSVVSIGTIVRDDVPANVVVSSHVQRVVQELESPSPLPPSTWPTWWQRPR